MSRQVRLSEESIRFEGRDLPYRLRRDPRRRRVCLLVNREAHLELRAPLRVPRHELERFLLANGAWALQQLESARARRADRPTLSDGTRLPLLDGELTLRLAFGRPRARRHGDELHLALPQPEAAPALLERWYREEARRLLSERIAHYAPLVGRAPAALTIRAQQARWGSCSARGRISLNWRLLLLPLHAVDYVVVHELCHLRHLNHSPAFWREVERVMPDYAARRALLRQCETPL